MSRNVLSIRQLRADDMPDIESILDRSFSHDEIRRSYTTELDYLIKNGVDRYLLCADSGLDVIGFIHGTNGDNAGEVDYIAVDTDYRKEGVGKSLMSELAHRFRDDGMYSIMLVPTVDSVGFYKSLGFHMNGQSKMMANVDDILKNSSY
ncbi:MAG: GNAT family N-acetyltransferase [Nanoarchaeota archaeon]